MARDDPNQQRRIVPISIKLRCDNHDELKEQHGADLSRGFFFVRTRHPKPVDTLLRFGLQLSHGETVLRGVGRVAMVVEPEESRDKPGMMLQLRALDATSQLVMKALGWDLRLPTTRAGSLPPPPMPQPEITRRNRVSAPPRGPVSLTPHIEEDLVEEDDRRTQTVPGIPLGRPPPPPEDDDEVEQAQLRPPPPPEEDEPVEPEQELEPEPDPEPDSEPQAEAEPEQEPQAEPEPEAEPEPPPPEPEPTHLSSRTIVVMNPLDSIFQTALRGHHSSERELSEDDFAEKPPEPAEAAEEAPHESTIEAPIEDEVSQEPQEDAEEAHSDEPLQDFEPPHEEELAQQIDAIQQVEPAAEDDQPRDYELLPDYTPGQAEGELPSESEPAPEDSQPENESAPRPQESDDGRYPTLFMEEAPQFQPAPARADSPRDDEVTRLVNDDQMATTDERPELPIGEQEYAAEVAEGDAPLELAEADPVQATDASGEILANQGEEPPSPPTLRPATPVDGPRTIPPATPDAEPAFDPPPNDEAPSRGRGRRSIAPTPKPADLTTSVPMEGPPSLGKGRRSLAPMHKPAELAIPAPEELQAGPPSLGRGRKSISPTRKPAELAIPPVEEAPPAGPPSIGRGRKSISPMRKPPELVSPPPAEAPPGDESQQTAEAPQEEAPTPIGRARDKKRAARAREEAEPAPQAREEEAKQARGAATAAQAGATDEAAAEDAAVSASGSIIAVDFGTCNTSIARFRGGGPELVPSPEGDFSLPSLFAIDKRGRELLGREARGELLQHSKNAIFASARLLGRPFQSPTVRELHKQVPFTLVEAVDGDVEVETGGKPLTVRVVASKILGEAMVWARKQSRTEVKRAVITVPGCFTTNQRKALRDAAELAGFSVERLVSKGAAAAVFYGFDRVPRQRILVYRLGGGSFDVSVVEIKGGKHFSVVGTTGDSALGGIDFDMRLEEILLERLEKEHNRTLGTNPVIVRQLIEAAEAAKIALSERDLYNVGIPFLALSPTQLVDFDTSLTRADLERVTTDLVERTIDLTNRLLTTLKLKPGEIGDVVVVGGQSRMPLIRSKLRQIFGKDPARGVNPEEAIALGAALLAEALEKPGDQSISVTESLPSSIGIALPGGKFKKVLEAGASIPNSASHSLATVRDDQTELELFVFQGESERALDNHFLGWARLDGVQRAPKGVGKALLDLRVGPDGLLTIARRDRPSDAEKPVLLSVKMAPKELRDKVGDGPAPAAPERRSLLSTVRRSGRG